MERREFIAAIAGAAALPQFNGFEGRAGEAVKLPLQWKDPAPGTIRYCSEAQEQAWRDFHDLYMWVQSNPSREELEARFPEIISPEHDA